MVYETPEPSLPPPDTGVRFLSGVSTSADASIAAGEVGEQLRAIPEPDLLLVFVSAHHADELGAIGKALSGELQPRAEIGVTTAAVVAGDRELEHTPAVSALAARLPGVRVHPFHSASLRHSAATGEAGRMALGQLIGRDPSLRATLVFADPFSTPVNHLLPQLNECRAIDRTGRPAGVIIGGVVSGAAKAGQNAMLCNDTLIRTGFVGVSISGPVHIDTVVSQGCRPLAENMIITKAKNNIIYELGGRPALDVFREAFESLGEHERELLQQGLFLGRVVSEYKDHTGRGDYLIRNVAGVNPETGYIAVQDLVRVGQTVRFHTRDAQTAEEDLDLLLHAQQLHGRPDGVLLITCTGRGTNLFDHRHHDAMTIQQAFRDTLPAPEQAKGGRLVESDKSLVPLAGCFTAGEIGPVGDQSYLHGHSACAVMFRR